MSLGSPHTSTPAHISARLAGLAALSLPEAASLRADIDAALAGCDAHLAQLGVRPGEPLVTPDGFPRADIDVHEVALTRANAARLRNDGSAVQRRLAELLEKSPLARGSVTGSTSSGGCATTATTGLAYVAMIAPGGPAATAGLRDGDLLLTLSGYTETGQQPLKQLQLLVLGAEDGELSAKVRRPSGETVDVTLRPRRGWGGAGLLGCRLDAVAK